MTFITSYALVLLPSKFINAIEYGLSDPFVISSTSSEKIGCEINNIVKIYFFIMD
jgi:hypothetical protein